MDRQSVLLGAVNGPSQHRFQRILLAVVMFATGTIGMIIEYQLGAMSSNLLGNSSAEWPKVIAFMTVGMAGGTYLQSRFKRGLYETFIMVELAMGVLGGFAVLALFAAYVKANADFALVQYTLLTVIGVVIGLEIPLAQRINERYTDSLSSNIKGILLFDYLGCGVGAFLFVQALKQGVSLPTVGFAVGALSTFIALVLLMVAWRHIAPSARLLLLPIGLVFAAILMAGGHSGAWSKSLLQGLYEDPIIHAEQSAYQMIVMTKYKDPQGQVIDLFLNGNKQFSSEDEELYHESLVLPAMTMAKNRSRVLILGGGDGLALREVLKFPGVQEVNLVDLDPAMIRLAQTQPDLVKLNQAAFKDARVTTSVEDPSLGKGATSAGFTAPLHMSTGDTTDAGGRQEPKSVKVADVSVFNVDAFNFVRKPRQPYDVVIVDLPDPSVVEIAKLYSREFYGYIRQMTAPGGLMVVQASSPFFAGEAHACVLKTVGSAGWSATLPYHLDVPSFGDWGFVLAWNGGTKDQAMADVAAVRNFPVETSYMVDGDTWRAQLQYGKQQLRQLRDPDIKVSTILDPAIVPYYIYKTRESF